MVTKVGRTIVGTCVTYKYVGKSTDKKPMSTNGSKFIELDTDIEYFFDGDEQGWSTQAGKYLDSIEITTAPTKVSYVEGDEFDATGMVVTAIYDNNTSAPVTTYTVECSSPLTVEDTKVKIIYTENGRTRTVEQAIEVEALALSSIAFTANPTLSYTASEALDLTGAEVTATFNNDSVEIVTEDCEFTPADGTVLTVDDTTLTASYTHGEVTKTASLTLVVTGQLA